nr:hypothetical protein [Sphingobium algorifonticola]
MALPSGCTANVRCPPPLWLLIVLDNRPGYLSVLRRIAGTNQKIDIGIDFATNRLVLLTRDEVQQAHPTQQGNGNVWHMSALYKLFPGRLVEPLRNGGMKFRQAWKTDFHGHRSNGFCNADCSEAVRGKHRHLSDFGNGARQSDQLRPKYRSICARFGPDCIGPGKRPAMPPQSLNNQVLLGVETAKECRLRDIEPFGNLLHGHRRATLAQCRKGGVQNILVGRLAWTIHLATSVKGEISSTSQPIASRRLPHNRNWADED